MTHEELLFRDNLAVKLMVKMATRPSVDDVLVTRSFALADQACARINADLDKLVTELNAKTEKARAARQAEFEALVGELNACGSTSANTTPHKQAQGTGQIERRKSDCDCRELRRKNDKIEVRELTPEQALDMITSLLARH